MKQIKKTCPICRMEGEVSTCCEAHVIGGQCQSCGGFNGEKLCQHCNGKGEITFTRNEVVQVILGGGNRFKAAIDEIITYDIVRVKGEATNIEDIYKL